MPTDKKSRESRLFTIIFILSVILVGLFIFAYTTKQPLPSASIIQQSASPIALAPLGSRTKISNCVVQGALPDSACSPGAIIPTATNEQICQPGYASSVRNVPESEKKAVYAEYGITTHTSGQYEVDHLISLELGGSNDIANLWPEAADPRPGFHEKDIVENKLHSQVCSGEISLSQAQLIIAHNWLQKL